MSAHSSGRPAAFADVWQNLLKPLGNRIGWICDEMGNLMEATPILTQEMKKDLEEVWLKHKAQKESTREGLKFISLDGTPGLNPDFSGLFSCNKIQIDNQVFLLFQKVNPQTDLQLTNDQLIAEEFGIFSWHFHLDTNRFFFPAEATAKLFNRKETQVGYQEFYSALSPESLHRFSEAMESAINYGKGFRLELMLEHTSGYRWISFSCRSTTDHANSSWLTGLIRDLEQERKSESGKQAMDQWLNVGLAKLEVKNAEGEILATWGNHLKGKNITIEPGRRLATLFDFRNNPKYSILAETGNPDQKTSVPEAKATAALSEIKPESASAETHPEPEATEDKSFLPIDKLNKEEKCVALTQWLGQSLDAQVSALGIFDGSRFEWKAWWKSPNRFALPVRKYAGEWLPELDWLVDVETDNQKFSDRYWWPQDMLPFEISESFGKGWMVLAEPISNKETTVFAIKTADPEGLREKTQHVLKSLDLLKDAPVAPVMQSVDQLKAELARKDMLIKEMNHRAKNNLALAASLVKMQAGFTDDNPSVRILKQTQKRLETLASIHELMYLSPDARGTVEIRDYLTQLTEGLVSSFGNPGVKLELHLDSVTMDMKTANTIGLLVNELISNAFKHAFSNDRAGVLKIDFLEKEDSFKLRVSDNGPGFDPENRNATSLGNILIDEFVKQLHGTMEIDNSIGTTYLISLKKSIIGS